MSEFENENYRELETRENGSQQHTESYSEQAVGRLKNLIETFSSEGEPKYYSISVDGEQVVARTSDVEKFDHYLHFMSDLTKTLEVRLYLGNSPNHNKYVFVRRTNLNGLDGMTKRLVEEAVAQERSKYELNDLRKSLDQRDKRIKKFKRKLRRLEGAQPSGLGNVEMLATLIEKGAQLFSGITKKNSEQLHGVEPQKPVDAQFSEESQAELIFSDLLKAHGEEKILHLLGVVQLIAENENLLSLLSEEIEKMKENGKA